MQESERERDTTFPEWAWRLVHCPITSQELQPANPELIHQLQLLQGQGQLMNRLGVVSEHRFDGGMVNLSRTFFYPMQQGIPTLIPDEAICLSNIVEKT